MHVCIIYHVIKKSKILLHLFIRLLGHKRLVNSLIYSGKYFLVSASNQDIIEKWCS